ncbi:hypothetical protein EDC94DRAFT_493155, partial [Helicostylum pulchrum]
IIQSRVWRDTFSNNGYILEVSKLKDLTNYQHLSVIHSIYGSTSFHGIKFLGKPTQRYFELYPKDAILEKFITEGV